MQRRVIVNKQVFVTSIHSKSINIAHISRVSISALSEDDILYLNDLLLTNGFHQVVVKNMDAGCAIIETFLICLNKYQWIYWLSGSDKKNDHIYNLEDDLRAYGCLASESLSLYEAYFSEQFHADCLVIACTQQLMRQKWYYYFYQALKKNSVAQHIPIIQLITHLDT